MIRDFFFCQAEDGIRDFHVTGVQTCALPISDFSKTELLAYYARIRDEGFSDNDKVQRYRACKLEIKTTPKMDVMADGVMLGKGKVEIKSKPGAVWIITPGDHIA